MQRKNIFYLFVLTPTRFFFSACVSDVKDISCMPYAAGLRLLTDQKLFESVLVVLNHLLRDVTRTMFETHQTLFACLAGKNLDIKTHAVALWGDINLIKIPAAKLRCDDSACSIFFSLP